MLTTKCHVDVPKSHLWSQLVCSRNDIYCAAFLSVVHSRSTFSHSCQGVAALQWRHSLPYISHCAPFTLMMKQWLFWQSEPQRWRKWPVTLNFRCIMKSSLLDNCPGETTRIGQKNKQTNKNKNNNLSRCSLLSGKFKCDIDKVTHLDIRLVKAQVDHFWPGA